MRTGVLTAYYENYKPLADIVVPNLEDYCIRHNYLFCTYIFPSSGVHYSFKRIKAIRDLLNNEDIDLILCLDIDVLITNHNIKIESFIDSEHDFYITKDINGINAGNFIVKNTDWSKSFLDYILSHQETKDNDQEVIESIKEDEIWEGKIKILSHPSINSYPYEHYGPNFGAIGDRKVEKPTTEEGNWGPGNFIIHLPGMPLEKRIELLREVEVWK